MSQLAEIMAAHPAIAPDEEKYVDQGMSRMLTGDAVIAETGDAKLDAWLNQMGSGLEKLRNAHSRLEKMVPSNGSVSGSH